MTNQQPPPPGERWHWAGERDSDFECDCTNQTHDYAHRLSAERLESLEAKVGQWMAEAQRLREIAGKLLATLLQTQGDLVAAEMTTELPAWVQETFEHNLEIARNLAEQAGIAPDWTDLISNPEALQQPKEASGEQ